MDNKITLTFLSISQNEAFARSVAGLFALQLNPSVADLTDIKTAVSEAVTNSIVHAYPNVVGEITMECEIIENCLHINIFDKGIGIENLEKAQEPFYTTKLEEERSGMGFTIMKSFMNSVNIESKKGLGTKIYMVKNLSPISKEV